jgi:hypothetical protein
MFGFSMNRGLKAAVAKLGSEDAHTREDGLLALQDVDLKGAPDELCVALETMAQDAGELPPLRATAAWRLHGAGRPEGFALLEAFLGGDEPPLRWRSVGILGQLAEEDERAAALIRGAVTDADPRVRLHATYALAELDPSHDAGPTLIALVQGDDEELQIEAIKALGTLPPSPEGLAALRACAEGPSDELRTYATMTLLMLGEESPDDPAELAQALAAALRPRCPDYDPRGPEAPYGLQQWIHPAGSFRLTLPAGWVRAKHDPDAGQQLFRPCQDAVGELGLQTLGVGGPPRAGRCAAVLEQFFPAIKVESSGKITAVGDAEDESAWCDVSFRAEEGLRTGRLWLRLRGEEGVFASYDCPHERAAESAGELESAHGAFRALEFLSDAPDMTGWLTDALGRVASAGAIGLVDGVVHLDGGGVDLDVLEEWIRAQPAFARSLTTRYAREILALRRPRHEAPPLDAVRHRLRPLFRPDVFFEDMGELRLARRPFVSKVEVVYVLDDAYDRPYVRAEWLETWGIDGDELHELSLAGLEATSHFPLEEQQDEEGVVRAVQCSEEDGYALSRLLLPSFVKRLVPQLSSPFVALLPREDLLLTLVPPPSEEALSGLRQAALGLSAQGPFPISPALLECQLQGDALSFRAL